MTEININVAPKDLYKAQRKYYKNRLHNDAEFYEAEKKRVEQYIVNRYKTDPEYRERILRQKRESYQRCKAKKQQEALTV